MADLWGLAGPAGAADEAWDPIPLTGRVRRVRTVALPPGPDGSRDLLVVYVEELPPGEARHLDLFRASDLAGAGPVAPARALPPGAPAPTLLRVPSPPRP